jgi:hypothetical protein
MFRSAALAAALVTLAACDDDLAVTNPNQGDTRRVLGTPNDAENLLGSYYRRWHSGVYGSTADLQGMMNIMSLMNYSSLANNCQNARAPFAGAFNGNLPGNTCQGEQYRLYNILAEVNRIGSSILQQMKPVADGGAGLTFGTPARDARAKAFSEFLRGMAIAQVAQVYDSLAVVTDAMTGEDPGKLVGYREAFDSAVAAFDRAIAYTNENAPGSDGFPLPATWISSPTSFTKAEFVRLIRSYRARFRADLARSPDEPIDWDAVIADVDGGITADHLITTNTVTGPTNSWRSQYGVFNLWHQMPPFFIGMADTSGSYAAWIAQPLGDRGSGNVSFTMATPDLRFPQGATRAAQQADFQRQQCQGASQVCKRYFENRQAGEDQNQGLGWGWSNYNFVRFHSWRTSGDGTQQNGNTLFMSKAEMDLLKAEALYNKGQFAAAAAIVNTYRTRNGLPAITTFDATTPVPGGNACVPKVPQPPAFNTVACGRLIDALKYERRIETAYVHYGAWFLPGRRWKDLPEGTPLFWAVPYQDLQARGKSLGELYGAGLGAGNAPNSVAPRSNYGW